MNKMRLLLSALLVFGLTQETYTKWRLIQNIEDKAVYDAAVLANSDAELSLHSYQALNCGQTEFQKSNGKNNTQMFRLQFGKMPDLTRCTYIFDRENNFISYTEERMVPSTDKTPDKRKSSGKSSPDSTISNSSSNSSSTNDSAVRLSSKQPGFFARNGRLIFGSFVGYLIVTKLRSMHGKRNVDREQRQREQEA